MSNDKSLDDWRADIDRLDKTLVTLLNERARAAQAIGAIKTDQSGSIFVPHREQAVFKRVETHNEGPLPNQALRAIWREVMSASIALERPLRICHFAQPGSFTNLAARLKFGESVGYHSVESIRTVFDEVERGHADYGVVPIENSTDGGITDTIDSFLATHLRIVSEMFLRIRHHVMARCEFGDIRRIYSKHTVFSQCREWLASNLPSCELVEIGSTTLAAERAAKETGAAAIGNREAAAHFGLQILAEDIQDNPGNMTRFVVLALPDRAAAPSGDDKTSLMFGVQDRPGALYEALIPFHAQGINLTRIESRPSRRQAWEYLFFIDILGHVQESTVADVLRTLASSTTTLQVLGSYPRAEHPLNQ